MLAQGARHIPEALLRSFTSSSVSAAAPALLSGIFGGGSRIDVPLSEALMVPTPPGGGVPKTLSAPQTTTLASGAKLATLDTASPISSLALFLEGGSSAETPATAGVSKVLEAVAFKSTANRTTFRLTRELEKVGASARCIATRDHIAFSVDFVKVNSREAVEMLVDSVVNARYTYWEVRDTIDTLKEQLAEALRNPNVVLSEVLHRAAFEGGLGNSLMVDPAQVSGISNDTLREYLAAVWNPSRLVLGGVGVEHGEVKALANGLIPNASPAPAPANNSKYVGGALSVLAPASPLTHSSLAFEVRGGLSDAKAAAAAAVVKALLDEARPTLPHARKESPLFASLTPFATLYKSTGLVGVSGACVPGQAGALVDGLCKKIEALATSITEAQLSHAKALAIGEYRAKISTSAGLLAAAGPSLLLSGSFDPAATPAKIAALSAADVSAFVQALTKSAPTLATYGNLSSLPRVDVSKRFA